jgi:hypothetical protein
MFAKASPCIRVGPGGAGVKAPVIKARDRVELFPGEPKGLHRRGAVPASGLAHHAIPRQGWAGRREKEGETRLIRTVQGRILGGRTMGRAAALVRPTCGAFLR